jgi:acyl-ACP thioesterase
VTTQPVPGGPGPFEAPIRVRFDEAAPDGHLRTSNVLRYAQDLAWLHSASLGFGRDWYGEHGLTWLVRAAEFEVRAPVGVGTALTGSTRVVGFRRVWSRRRSEFHDASGALVAWVHIDWVLIDARGAPTRIPASIESIFGSAAVDTNVSLGRVSLDPPPDRAARSRVVVRPQELDPMDHVNNAVYADWLDEAVIAAGDPDATRVIPRRVAIEYAAAAAPGQVLEAIVWRADRGWAFRLTDAADGTELVRATLGRPPG